MEKTYMHTGIPVAEKMDGMAYMEGLKVWICNNEEYKIEYLYWEKDTPCALPRRMSPTRWPTSRRPWMRPWPPAQPCCCRSIRSAVRARSPTWATRTARRWSFSRIDNHRGQLSGESDSPEPLQ